ncbi:oxidation resistance protein 1 [Tirmania nivea]|nr:oxidation resistance protein 1 [Tirmania nivea]
MPTTASTASSSHASLPGTLSSALSWTLSRWNSSSNTSSSACPSSQGTASTQNTLHPTHPTEYRSSYPPSTRSTSSRPPSRPPSRRRASPFQPPPLPPLSLLGYAQSTTTHILTPYLAEEIRQLVPPRLQLHDSWILAYSLEQHGVSLTTLYERCAAKEFSKGGFVLVVKDDGGGIFGAFVNEEFRVNGGRYYGTGECFLWKAGWVKSYKAMHAQNSGESGIVHHLPHLHQNNKANGVDKEKEKEKENESELLVPPMEVNLDNSNIISDEGRPSRVGTPSSISENVLKFKAFPYSGDNEYFILCEQGFLSVGAGNGKFGLWLDSNLEKGVSSPCATFGNEPLSEEGEKFEIMGVEVWSIGGTSSR